MDSTNLLDEDLYTFISIEDKDLLSPGLVWTVDVLPRKDDVDLMYSIILIDAPFTQLNVLVVQSFKTELLDEFTSVGSV